MAAVNSSPSGFSYAQAAAKAHAPATNSQTPSSKVTSGTATPATGTFSELGPNSNWADDVEATEGDKTTESRKTTQEQAKSSQAKDSAVERTKSESRVQNGSSGVSSPDLTASSSTTTNTDDASSAPSGTSSSDTTWDTKSQNSEPAWIAERKERQSSAHTDDGKGRRGKKDAKEPKEPKEAKEAALLQAPPKPVVLQDAPPPPVNPWAKRMEDAKAKSTVAVPTAPMSRPAQQVSQTQPAIKENQRPGSDARKKSNSVASVAREPEAQVGDVKKSGGVQGEVRTDSVTAPNRAAQREHQSMPNLTSAPPPVKDETSWPTPESAQEKERKEAAAAEKETTKETEESGDAETNSGAKSREKTKWKPIPVTPTIVWETEEMNRPPRGQGERSGRGGSGRGRGGFRGAPNGAKGGAERSAIRTNGTTDDAEGGNAARGRSNTVDRESMPPPPKPGRPSSASESREGRKARDDQSFSARQRYPKGSAEGSLSSENANSATPFSDARRSKSPSKMDLSTDSQDVKIPEPIPRHSPAESQRESSREAETSSAAKATSGDGKKDPKSFDSHSGKEWNGAPRGGKRNGRGRGGSREFINSHQTNQMFTNGHAIEFAGGNPFAVPASPSAYQSTRGQFSFGQGRGGWPRGNPRSQSIPVENGYGGRPAPYWPQQMPPMHPYYPPMYDYPGGAPMSAMPYHPAMEQQYLMDMVSTQLEYYFSIDNLIKDMYLRKNMDSQGFVFLDIIANFNRIKQLTTDKDFLKAVCLRSDIIEIRTGEDGKDRLRRHEQWESFLLPKDQRDPSAQNDGPQSLHRPEHPPLHFWSPPMAFRGPPSAGLPGPRRSYDSSYQMNGNVPNFAPFSPLSENPFGEMSNGEEIRGRAAKSPIRDNSASPTRQAIINAAESHKDAEPDVFPDEQTGTLTVVVKMNHQRASNHAASRTFSNGSIDTRNVFGDMDKSVEQPTTNGEPVVNGDKSSPSLTRLSSPSVGRSPEKTNGAAELMLLWVKDKEFPQDNLPQDATLEPYVQLHQKALDQRKQAATGTCPYDLDVLYQFWSHFLIRNFNMRMYAEFKGLAHGDAEERLNSVGLQNLVQFYAKALASSNPIRDHVVSDYVALVKNEPSITSKLAFKQLRQAWRNGALNLKNRKKLADIVDDSLRAQLES